MACTISGDVNHGMWVVNLLATLANCVVDEGVDTRKSIVLIDGDEGAASIA